MKKRRKNQTPIKNHPKTKKKKKKDLIKRERKRVKRIKRNLKINQYLKKTLQNQRKKDKKKSKDEDEDYNDKKDKKKKKGKKGKKDTEREEQDEKKSTLKYKDGEGDAEDYEKYNITEDMDKSLNDTADYYNEDEYSKDKDQYKDIDYVDDNKKSKKKKKVKPRNEEVERERKEWEEKVANFLPTDLLTIKLKPNSMEYFYEDMKVLTNITIAYYINDENQKIDFKLLGPGDVQLFKQKGKGQLFYEFHPQNLGMHRFVLDNTRYKGKKKVTFAIHAGNNTDETLKTEHVSGLNARINNIDKKIKDVHFNQKMMVRKFEGHYETTRSHNKNIVMFSLLESGIMITILLVQMFYIKSLLGE